jgi:murein DD-endopeptidase MepM/ murein hydrolase activator NlpD
MRKHLLPFSIAIGISGAFIFSVSNVQSEVLSIARHSIVFPLLAPKLSSKYGPRNHPIKKIRKHHSGVDLAAPEKSHVRSIRTGTVVFAGYLPGYGKTVTVKHHDTKVSLYGHLSKISVQIGQEVNAGAILGLVGSTGAATGPHLHFEWRENGKPLDPLSVFPSLAEEPLG